jgi:Xaa-Pro aminopeptidase
MFLRVSIPFGLALIGAAAPGAPPQPTVTPAFFRAHRERVLARLGADSIAVFRNPAESGGATTDPYRSDSDFWYLTGFSEPGAVAVLRPNAPDGKRYVLFVAPKDFSEEQWTGFRAGVEGAVKEYGADEAHPIGELWNRLPALTGGASSLMFRDGGDTRFRDQLAAAWNSGDSNATLPRPLADAGPIVHQLRLVKDETEQALLRRAAVLSAEAHRLAMTQVRPGRSEAALKAAMVTHCLAGGAARMAYPPIVASGRNAVILHYQADDQAMAAGGMIVNDSACEFGMYAADVTRSYPVSGRFSPEQRAIYEIVLASQKAAIAMVKPGVPFRDVHMASVDVIVDGLLKLGILGGDREEIVRTRGYQKFYPHGCSHWLGLDVHDAGSYGYPPGVDRRERYGKATTRLEPGMALTVEPGIYAPEGSTTDRRWWNIGARIEDDLLVTAAGAECLSCSAPREIVEVESAIAGKR